MAQDVEIFIPQPTYGCRLSSSKEQAGWYADSSLRIVTPGRYPKAFLLLLDKPNRP
jgi:hypothetical protein